MSPDQCQVNLPRSSAPFPVTLLLRHAFITRLLLCCTYIVNSHIKKPLNGDLVLQVMAYFAQTERDSIRQRQAEGIAAAKAKGKHLGRKAMPLPDSFESICGKHLSGEITTREAASVLCMSHSTFCRRFHVWEEKIASEGRHSETNLV